MEQAEIKWKQQYKTFIEQTVISDEKSFFDPLKKNSLKIFSNQRIKKKTNNKLQTMRSDLSLFSRMFIACQHRDGDLDNVFAHENHSWPPSLADNDEMRSSSKSDLMEPLDKLCENSVGQPDAECIVIDGAAVCQSIDPHRGQHKIKTFEDYATKALYSPCPEAFEL